jgi:hypothetical protein
MVLGPHVRVAVAEEGRDVMPASSGPGLLYRRGDAIFMSRPGQFQTMYGTLLLLLLSLSLSSSLSLVGSKGASRRRTLYA